MITFNFSCFGLGVSFGTFSCIGAGFVGVSLELAGCSVADGFLSLFFVVTGTSVEAFGASVGFGVVVVAFGVAVVLGLEVVVVGFGVVVVVVGLGVVVVVVAAGFGVVVVVVGFGVVVVVVVGFGVVVVVVVGFGVVVVVSVAGLYFTSRTSIFGILGRGTRAKNLLYGEPKYR